MDAEVSTEVLSSKIEEMKVFYNNKIIHQFFIIIQSIKIFMHMNSTKEKLES